MASPAMAVVTTAHTQPQQSQINVEGETDVAASDLPGDGTESNPYEISNVSELQAMEDDLDANYELVSDIDASQTAQFNDGAGFDPVGGSQFNENTPSPFTGTFDGTTNTITGLTISRQNETDIGLFGATGNGATLRNVTLANVTVTGTGVVGGLLGENAGTITDSSATGSVTATTFVGGLVGINNFAGTVQNSSASGSVTGDRRVGGLVGSNRANIQNATASGNVTGTDDVGGLVGRNRGGKITAARASGSVTGDRRVGGLVGLLKGDSVDRVRQAFAVGPVSGKTDVGGLIGSTTRVGRATNSYWDTQATGVTTSAGIAIGLTTAEMQGQAAAENMNLTFGETWQTVSGDYPELIALSESNANGNADPPRSRDEADTTTSVTVKLDSVPAGLQTFNVSVAGPSGSSITTVSAGVLSGNSFEIVSGGEGDSTVTARGADITGTVEQSSASESESEPVRLYEAEFEFEGTVERSDLTVTVTDLTNDDGAAMPENLLTVTTAGENPVIVGDNQAPAADLNGDGKLEDVNGDGQANFDDAIELAFNIGAASNNAESFDFDDDGDVDFDDAIALAFAV